MKKGSKNEIPLHGAIFWALVSGKIIKLALQLVWKKKLHKMAYVLWTCVDSKAYAHGNGHIHGIIHDYLPKFGTNIGVTIVYNVSIGICNYLVIESKIFIFQVLEMIFCEGCASNSFKICSIAFFTKIRSHWMAINQVSVISEYHCYIPSI